MVINQDNKSKLPKRITELLSGVVATLAPVLEIDSEDNGTALSGDIVMRVVTHVNRVRRIVAKEYYRRVSEADGDI